MSKETITCSVCGKVNPDCEIPINKDMGTIQCFECWKKEMELYEADVTVDIDFPDYFENADASYELKNDK